MNHVDQVSDKQRLFLGISTSLSAPLGHHAAFVLVLGLGVREAPQHSVAAALAMLCGFDLLELGANVVSASQPKSAPWDR